MCLYVHGFTRFMHTYKILFNNYASLFHYNLIFGVVEIPCTIHHSNVSMCFINKDLIKNYMIQGLYNRVLWLRALSMHGNCRSRDVPFKGFIYHNEFIIRTFR
jgi:hypothetical protein